MSSDAKARVWVWKVHNVSGGTLSSLFIHLLTTHWQAPLSNALRHVKNSISWHITTYM